MAPKRKGDESGELNSRERKKLKIADARTIAVQPLASGSGAGDNATNVSSAPSKTVVRFDSMQGLSATIDVERFTEARAYEIDAMQKAIKNAGESSTHRAWQTLPRHLRRRAASHDVRRVPQRLREKARAEMDTSQRKALNKQPKRGKANQLSRTEALLKRQRDKTWLETHIWHAKRMKMENMWGYRLAVTPTEKAFRPSHRASVHGSILHDASYYATIEVKGPQSILQAALESCCDPQVYGMKRSLSGGRACYTHIYMYGRYPFDLIAPITLIWQPLSSETPSLSSSEAPSNTSAKRKGKGKEKQADEKTPDSPYCSRVLWVRCHPSIFDDVYDALKDSCSHALQANKERDPTVHAEIEIDDLRGSVNAFEITGPKSSQVIRGALSPAGGEDRQEFKKFWESMADLQTAGSIPRGMVIGFKVLDPRLKFPPKNAKAYCPDATRTMASPSSAFFFPSSNIAQSEIWDAEKRGGLKKPRYKKKDIDERRSKNLVPGTPLNPLRQDDRIPVLLIQRSLEPCPPSTSTSSSTQGIHGWTLMFPAGWSMPFLSSLVYTGTRIAGQRERMKQYFEAGTPGFPNDYPTIPAYETASSERAETEKAQWERKPPAKRVSWDKLGTRSPWRPDWGLVLGVETSRPVDAGEKGDGLVPAQRESRANSGEMQLDDAVKDPRPWLLRGPKVPSILANPCTTPAQFRDEINKLRGKHHLSPLDSSVSSEDLVKTALVMVRAKMVGRGAPSDLANIYKMDDVEARKWIKAFDKRDPTRLGGDSEPNEYELGDVKASQEDIVGYVTTGDISLLRGEGFAIGAIPVVQYFALRKQAQR
ncbi:ribonucleases P/MRP protein subunit POP1-domain-containing protein [Phlebopus sp. FC_14]|nr:ribonucleases P/MRP protein subunit POP1-domain-containing protein [Phlebopus sp. FC_14]